MKTRLRSASITRPAQCVAALFAVCLTLLAPPLSVHAAAPWVNAAGFTQRTGHTATLMPNGKVLATGGYGSSGYLASTVLYDPESGASATGSLAIARYSHTATLLPNGKVLVVGGDNGGYLASAELYDPALGTWTATDGLATSRAFHTATLLPNGKVLVAGGYRSNGYVASAELYDPALGTWTATGSLATARDSPTATLLPNGKVLVAGGHGDSGSLASAEIYDPVSGTWTATGSLSNARHYHTATLLPNGKVLVAGGTNGSNWFASAELYDPALGTWTATGSLATVRQTHTATLLPNGKVLVTGGLNNGSTLGSTELYDPALGTWTATGSLATARYSHTATLLPSGQVLVAGGSNGNALGSAERYDSATGTFAATGNVATARNEHTATLLPNGKVLVVGGVSDSGNLASAELYDPALGTWTATGGLATARNRHTATLLPNGKVLVAGGYNGSNLASAEIYDPVSGTWTATGNLATARYLHTATLLPNGKVLVAGGYNNGSTLGSAELYDPASGTWTATGSLAAARYLHTATLLPNGKVLVAGGFGSGNPSSAELYDPALGTWTATGSLATQRRLLTATLLPNGKVLVAAGYSGSSYLASAELYDSALGTWTATGSLATARESHTVTLLPNGKVLVVGGHTSTRLASAELYDPASGMWTATGSLAAARSDHTATLLPNGKVLVAGGYNGSNLASASAELYDVGLGFSASWQPVVTSASFNASGQLVLSGTGFTGISGGSGGNSQDSPTNYPVVQLRWLDNEQSIFLSRDPAASATATAFTSTTGVNTARYGAALVTVYASGIPSTAAVPSNAPPPIAPTVTTPTSTAITATTATLGGNVTSDGGGAITERGVVYSITATNADPLISGTGVTTVTSAGTTGVFTAPVTGLAAVTGYSFKAYAINSAGTSYGGGISFTTTVPAPTVTLSTANLASTATTLTITGTGFDLTPGNNTVVFSNGAVGTVTGATATQLTVTFSTQPTSYGSLTVVVTNGNGSSGAPVQVATVVNALPVIAATGGGGPLVFSSLLSFTGNSGANPGLLPWYGHLVQGSDGDFYGMTYSGGTSSLGTVFKMTPAGLLTTLVEFTGSGGANHGAYPFGSLMQGSDGDFYGMTQQGGTSSLGTVFKMTPAGLRTTLVEFTGSGGANPGSYPEGSLVQGSDGDFYGMTQSGGTSDQGTVFKMTPAGLRTTLVDFTGSGGANPGLSPRGSLVQGSDGDFYGMTNAGGTSGLGTVFKMTPAGLRTTLVDFTGSGGANPGWYPSGSLVQGSDGDFYGMTYSGGTSNLGTVFKMTPAGLRTTLVNFTGTTGANPGSSPFGSLVQGSDGDFYGMTSEGGTSGVGTVFKMTPAGVRTTLADFTGSGGANPGASPRGSLVQGSDGGFYGMTLQGGTSGVGTVFKLGVPLPIASAAEGSLATQTGTFSDADGNATVALTASSGSITQNNSAGTWSWSATGSDGPATSTVTITATDSGSATATASFTFSVTNVAPTFDLGSNVSLPVGSGVLSETVAFTDPGADTWSGTVNYGDGGGNQTLSVNAGAKTFALSHTYTQTGTFTVSVTLNDDDGGSTTDSYTVTTLLNRAPTDIALSANSIAENNAANATVGTLTATDADVGQTHTFAKVVGAGDTDNASFTIDGTALKFIPVANYEVRTSYSVRIQANDGNGGTYARFFSVTITDANDAPVITSNGGLGTASVSVAENSTAVTDVDAIDADLPEQTLTYSLSGSADMAAFSIVPSTGVLAFTTVPNFEIPADANTNGVYEVTVQVMDNGTGTLTDTQAISVTVTDVNEVPVITSNGGLATGSVSVAENTTSVTTVTAVDPEVPATQTLTYSKGGTDAAFFTIIPSTGELTFTTAPNFEAPADAGTNNVYDVTVTVTDNGTGLLTDTQALSVTVTDANETEIVVENGTGTGLTDNVSSVAFGTTNIAEGIPHTFTIRNTGEGAMSIGAISFNGAHPDNFSVITTPATSVTGGGSTTLTVAFSPLQSGVRTAVMHIVNGDINENPFDITLTGSGTADLGSEWTSPGTPLISTLGVFDCTNLNFHADLGFVPTPDVALIFIQAAGGIIGNFNDLPDGGVVAMAFNGVIYYFQAHYGPNEITLTNFVPGAAAWIWTAGPKARNATASFSAIDVIGGNPGSRQGAMNWRAPDGSLWMFGGYGYATALTNPPRWLNDLWQYDRTLGKWIWRSGSMAQNAFGIYGTQGVEAPANVPGARHTGTTWTDASGNLWLFGGTSIAGRQNDLWRFNRTTRRWTWMKGSENFDMAGEYGTQGTPNVANTPGARQGSVGWFADGHLYLFGGFTGTAMKNDLWRYTIATGNWTWLSGSDTTNANGNYIANGNPGARRDATGWTAKDGTLWMFGGLGRPATGTVNGDLNDLWSYDPASNEWTWVSGSTTTGTLGTYTTPGATGTPGARSGGSGWSTVDGKFWLIGGFRNSSASFNDVWIYDPVAGTWTWQLGASTIGATGVYGTLGQANAANSPGARFTPTTWVTLNGALWIFGGGGVDGLGTAGRLSDLWVYAIPAPAGAPVLPAPEPFPDSLVINTNPSANNATAGTMAYVPVSGTLTGSDADGDRLTFTVLSQGTLSLQPNGQWTYTPAPGFTGTASFQFRANDSYGGQSPVRTLVVTVSTNPADANNNGIPDAYELATFGSVGIDPDGDADLDGQSNYFEYIANTDPQDANKRLTTAPSVSGTGANGTVILRLNHVRPGVNYHLETSDDLDIWTRLGTFTFSVSGSAEIEDPTPPSGQPRFYRMSLEAPFLLP